MSESALLFGRSKSLVGILTEPRATEGRTDPPGVVILNAGVLHHVGPSRVHVQLARALAEAGFPVLRFDLSGIGDSLPREGAETFAVSSLREIGEAFAVLEARGVRRFLVAGICSGADNGLRMALHEPRVVGAALVDGYNLANVAHTLHRYGRRALSARSWARLVLGRSEVWRVLWRLVTAARSEKPAQTRVESIVPSPDEYVENVRTLAERGTHLLLAYTGRSPAYFNYRRLIRKRLRSWPSRERVSVSYLEGSDHVFTLSANRRRLTDLVSDWARALP
jgi:pimeloyl-ACP methyl ester carboxylesterase